MPQLSHSRGDVKMELTVPNAGKDVEQQEKDVLLVKLQNGTVTLEEGLAVT